MRQTRYVKQLEADNASLKDQLGVVIEYELKLTEESMKQNQLLKEAESIACYLLDNPFIKFRGRDNKDFMNIGMKKMDDYYKKKLDIKNNEKAGLLTISVKERADV